MNYRCEKAAQWVIWGFDYYLTTKVTKSHLFWGKVTPRTRGQNPGNSPFLHHKQGNCNLNVSLVRTRSPVQIWLAAPETTVSGLLTVVFCFAVTSSCRRRCGGGLGRSPMLFPPGPPKTQRVFGVDRVTSSNPDSSSKKPSSLCDCWVFCFPVGFSLARGAGYTPVPSLH